jgi:outer membrane protein assembly factor BamB
VLFGWLLALFLANAISLSIRAGGKPNFAEPFLKCRTFGVDNGLTRIIASDNISDNSTVNISDNSTEIILTTDGYSLISLNTSVFKESWKSQTGGRLESFALTDENNLYVLSSYPAEDKTKIYNLTSASLKTGLTIWQKKIQGFSNLKLNGIKNGEFLFLLAGDKHLLAASKLNGQIIWDKHFPAPVTALYQSTPEKIDALLNDRLQTISILTGDVLEELNLKKLSPTAAVIETQSLLLGYETGETSKIALNGKREDVIWRIKAGGGISGLLAYQNLVLVTSLDNFIYLYSGDSGKLRWKKRVAGRINIKPQIFGDYALVLNSGDNSAAVIDLRDGKVVNQIQLEDENFFSGEPVLTGRYLVMQTSKGLYFYANPSAANCA